MKKYMLYRKYKDGINRHGRYFYIRSIIMIINRLFAKFIFPNRNDVSIYYNASFYGLKNIFIGKNFAAGKYFRLEAIDKMNNDKFSPNLIIGDNVRIHDFVHIGCTNRISIGNNVLIGSNVYISDHNHGIYSNTLQSDPLEVPIQRKVNNNNEIIIKDNVWIGEGCSVISNVTIGTGSIIGTNSVVCKDIPEYSIAVGSPARVIKKYDFFTKKWERV